MGRLTLRLPETLHQRLSTEAEQEGVSLNQYLVFLLAQREASQNLVWVSEAVRRKQSADFQAQRRRLTQPSPTDVQEALDARERVESDLDPSLVERLRNRLAS